MQCHYHPKSPASKTLSKAKPRRTRVMKRNALRNRIERIKCFSHLPYPETKVTSGMNNILKIQIKIYLSKFIKQFQISVLSWTGTEENIAKSHRPCVLVITVSLKNKNAKYTNGSTTITLILGTLKKSLATLEGTTILKLSK